MKFASAVQIFAAVGSADAYYKRRSLRSLRSFQRMNHSTTMVGAADKSCPCISADAIDKSSDPGFPTYHEVTYPDNVGTFCKDWDAESDPACKLDPTEAPGWCADEWCYVDPCTCGTMAKKSSYFPKLLTTGNHPVYYSYTTCKSNDAFTCTSGDATKRACPCHQDETACGKGENCRWNSGKCIGAELIGCNGGTSGTTPVATVAGPKKGDQACPCIQQEMIDTKTQPGYPVYSSPKYNTVTYPGNVGTSCKAWDMEGDPSCKVDEGRPGWCKSEWCYVDPCTCTTMAKRSSYFPKLKTTGNHDVFYSYTTCGTKEEAFTCSEGDASQRACPCNKDETACGKKTECKWKSGKCMGAELNNC